MEQILAQSYVTDETRADTVIPMENSVANDSATSTSPWLGRYRFIEKWPGDPPFVYTLEVTCLDGDSCATLSVYGPQTQFDVVCSVQIDGESLTIVYLQDAPDAEYNSAFTKGDVVFNLDRQEDEGVITRWNKLESIYQANRKPGKYFKKMLPGFIERELPADIVSDSHTGQEAQAAIAKPGVDIKGYDSRQPIDGMLVFKGLFIGMDIGQALLKLDEAIEFKYEIFDSPESALHKAGLGFKIFAVLEDKSIEITEAGVELPQNKFYKYVFLSPDNQLVDRIESHFNRLLDLEQALQLVVDELNAGLANWVQISEDGLLVASRYNLFTLIAKPNQELTKIVIEPPLTNSWFNVEDMPADKFVLEFITSYSIPLWEISIEPYTGSMVSTGAAGYKLTISDSKQITVEDVASSSERKFD